MDSSEPGAPQPADAGGELPPLPKWFTDTPLHEPAPPAAPGRQPPGPPRSRTGGSAPPHEPASAGTPAESWFALGSPGPEPGFVRPLPPDPPVPTGVFPDPQAPGVAALPPPPPDLARSPLPPPPPLAPRRRRGLALGATAVASGIIGAGLALAGFLILDDDPAPAPEAQPVTIVQPVRTELVDGSTDVMSVAPAVARAVIPSIVTVEVDSSGTADFITDGTGSGVVLDASGHIITNEHVVGDAEAVRVVFADGRSYAAEVVGTDFRTDLAVIRIDASELVPIRIGASRDLEIGDPAIAVGSPLGLSGGPSLTVGVISAFERRVQTGPDPQNDLLFGMIQTDAPITRGSSGGALVDVEGKLIGITSAIGVSNVGAEGIGFAIPVELVERVTAELIRDGVARHAFLGIGGQTEFEETSDGATVPIGVIVQSVESDSAAAAAGLEVGDRILSLDGEDVRTMDGLIVGLRDYAVGSDVLIAVQRDGRRLQLPVTLGERGDR